MKMDFVASAEWYLNDFGDYTVNLCMEFWMKYVVEEELFPCFRLLSFLHKIDTKICEF